MKTQVAAILLLAILSAVGYQAHAEWTRIKTVEEYNHALGVARLAVAARNKETGERLEFVRLYRGYVDGQYYRLFMQVKDNLVYRKASTEAFEKVPNKEVELFVFGFSS